jgi:hypothetical protein
MSSMARMAAKKHYVLGAVILLALLTLIELDSVYWLLFFLWRSAALPVSNNLWFPRIYFWLAVSIAIGATWIGLLIWIVRHGRKATHMLAK